MRRVSIAILVSALVSACLFAVPKEVFTTKEYSVNLAATVTAGNANVDPDEPGTGPSKPETDEHKGLAIKVGYAPLDSGSTYDIGNHYSSGELNGLTQHGTGGTPLTVSLTPEFDGDNTGSISFYVAASSDCDVNKGSSLNVKFEVTKNWTITGQLPTGVTNPEGKITLTSKDNGYSVNNGLSSTNSNAEVKVEASAGSRTETVGNSSFIYVGRVDATWEKSDAYAAGDYTAIIKVTVSAGD